MCSSDLAGGHRGVGGEDVVGATGFHGFVEGQAIGGHEHADAFQGEEGRVAFVHMEDGGLKAHGAQGTEAADAEDDRGRAPTGGEPHQLTRARRGGLPQVTFRRDEQRETGGRGHLDHRDTGVGREFRQPQQRARHPKLECCGPPNELSLANSCFDGKYGISHVEEIA